MNLLTVNYVDRVAPVQNYLMTGEEEFKTEFDALTEEPVEIQNFITKMNDSEALNELLALTNELLAKSAEELNSLVNEFKL